jgi:hypothetical protein
MLDLSKPLGEIDRLSLYGDHEQPDLVYYLPDEIDLRLLAEDRPDLALQIFFPDQAIAGGASRLEDAVGSILSLGVQCRLSPTREELVRSTVASRLGRDHLRLTPPPWEDGTVELLLLDTQSGATSTSAVPDDRMVRGVVGSRRPSLSDGLLSGLFHARLDRRGTALVTAVLNGQVGSLAGVLYDLKFAALRPSVRLRMSADLNQCAEFFRVGAGVQVYYVAADITASFGRMRQEGIIKVDLVSEASDPEAERLVNESVKDFYDVLMRELFRPTVSPAEALGAVPGLPAAQTSIVKFTFAFTRTEHERVIEVDYRKRAATRRTHNPQAHLRRLAELGGGVDRVVQRVPLSAAWREFEVEVAAPAAFDDASLRQARVVLWRGVDPVLRPEDARDGGLRMPAAAVPLADLAFTRDDAAPRRLSWVTQPDEPPFYRWQARLTYGPEDEVDSPAEIWSEPRVSSSGDLDLFPDILAPRRQTRLVLGAGHPEALRSVEAELVARDGQGQVLGQRRLAVDGARPEARWSVRRGEQHRIITQATLIYRYDEGRSLTRPPQILLDRELFANDPFMRTVVVSPLVVGAPTDVLEVVLVTRYADRVSGYQSVVTRRLRPPGFTSEDIEMPVLGSQDTVAWEATAVRGDGQLVLLGRGDTPGGVLALPFSVTRRIRVEWLGPSPADLGLRWLRATFRARGDDGQTIESATLEWRGAAVDGEQIVTLPSTGRAEWSCEKRFEDGRKETSPFALVDSDLLAVSG